MQHAARLFDKQVKRRRLTLPEARRKMALLHPTLDYSGFRPVDLVIEAIVENLGVKQEVFAETAKHVADGAILASNTSSLSIAGIGARTPHPERVVGMHFFNPVDKMPLVEVIAAEGSDPAAVNTVFAFTRKLGKTPVLVKDTPGFLVNRLLMFYSTEALWLLDEGYRIEDLDRAMTDWGMPVGPMALTDEVGIDVATKVAHILHDAFGDRLPLPAWLDRLPQSRPAGHQERQGLLSLRGAASGRSRTPAVYALLGLIPGWRTRTRAASPTAWCCRWSTRRPAAWRRGWCAAPRDLDLALIFGTGFPPFRGGLCRWADQEGLGRIIATLERLESAVGDRFPPSDALRARPRRAGSTRGSGGRSGDAVRPLGRTVRPAATAEFSWPAPCSL